MDKRALIAIALSIAVMMTWQVFFAPDPPIPPEPSSVDAPAPSASGPETPGLDDPDRPPAEEDGAATLEDPESVSSEPIRADREEQFRVTTRSHDVRFTNEGGRITWWRLLQYTLDGGLAVNLVPERAIEMDLLPFQIVIDADPELTSEIASALHVHEITDIPAGDPSGMGPGQRLSFTYSDGKGLEVRKNLELPEEGYLGRVSFEVKKDGAGVPATLLLASGLTEQAGDETYNYWHFDGGGVIHDWREIQRFNPKETIAPLVGPVLWGGLESTYFAALVLPPEGAEPAPETSPIIAIEPHAFRNAAGEEEPLLTAGIRSSGTTRIFVGPKDYSLLSSVGHELDRVIDFSRYSLIYAFTRWLFLALTWINSYVGNYGWSIIILTVLVRSAFFPITYRSQITMRQTSKKMGKIQPKVKAIQQRYQKVKKTMESQRKMNEEVMALYKKEGVNPMASLGGCLPLLLQMPVFIAFYNLLAVTIEVRQAPFIFWIHDLSSRDPYFITPILMGISWLLQQSMNSASIPDPMQRRMMMLMPVMFTFFMINMPSGLVLYWLTSNVIGMAQQYITNRKADTLESGVTQAKAAEAVSKRRAEDGHTA